LLLLGLLPAFKPGTLAAKDCAPAVCLLVLLAPPAGPLLLLLPAVGMLVLFGTALLLTAVRGLLFTA
jgi:hypothetical protein